MNKTLSLINPLVTVAIVGLVLGTDAKINAISMDNNNRQKDNSSPVAQNLNCPRLDDVLVPIRHPVRASLNRKFRAEGRNGEINNVVRVGNYGAAYWWTRTSATPVAIQFNGNALNRAVTITGGSNLANVLQSWGAAGDTAKCIHQLLEESGV
jgi:hypothetical protein